MTTLVLSALILLSPEPQTSTTFARENIVEIWTAAQPPNKRAGGLLIAGGIAAVVLGAIAKPPEAGPSVGLYVGAPVMAAGAFVQHRKRPATLVYKRPIDEASIPPNAWPAVQAITAGTRIKLVLQAGDVEGTFVAANADVLVIHLKKGNFSVDRMSIKRIDQRLPGSNRGRNVNRGLGLGLAAGIVRSLTLCEGCAFFGGVLMTTQSAVIGTVVGATASSARWETLYRTEK